MPSFPPDNALRTPQLTFVPPEDGSGTETKNHTYRPLPSIWEGEDAFLLEQMLNFYPRNSAGRTVVIALAADPDVRVQEEFSGKLQNKVAIEIKGGTDKSNAHNRAGEAEKSHQKARGEGFRDFWTIIAKKGLEIEKLRKESPTTNSWFDAAQVLGREGEDWEEFRNRLAGQVGIPLSTEK
jgi:hypothetical protein